MWGDPVRQARQMAAAQAAYDNMEPDYDDECDCGRPECPCATETETVYRLRGFTRLRGYPAISHTPVEVRRWTRAVVRYGTPRAHPIYDRESARIVLDRARAWAARCPNSAFRLMIVRDIERMAAETT